MVVVFNLLLDVVVAAVLHEFVLLNLVVTLSMTSFNALLVVNVLLNVVAPFFSVDVVVKGVVVKQFFVSDFC